MQYILEIFVLVLSILIILLTKMCNENAPPIFNIYQQSNGILYWIKVVFIYIMLSTRKNINKLKTRFGAKATPSTSLDKPQPLSSHPKAIDAVYFNGANKEGDYFVIGTARRKNKLVDGFMYLLIRNSHLGVLETPKLPSTALFQSEDTEEYEVEGIKVKPINPMRKWKISYDGKMKLYNNRQKTVDVKIDAEWISALPYFNFDTDMDAWCMAQSMAYERFSREYFENLKYNHQTHYEQHGDINGTAIIDNKKYDITFNAVRDHSFGIQREWRNFHRYGLHFLTTENGDRFNVGKICLPISFSRLTLGYVYVAKEQQIYPVTWCDLELYQHGENGTPPLDYAFSFSAGNKKYRMKVNVLHSPHFYISKDWESKVVERLCTFEVNGIKGWGAAEWQYRNVHEKNVADYNGF